MRAVLWDLQRTEAKAGRRADQEDAAAQMGRGPEWLRLARPPQDEGPQAQKPQRGQARSARPTPRDANPGWRAEQIPDAELKW